MCATSWQEKFAKKREKGWDRLIPCLNVVECGAKYIVCILMWIAPSAYSPENQVCSFFGVGASRVREPPGPPGPAGDPCASSARVRACGWRARTMSSSLESRANRVPLRSFPAPPLFHRRDLSKPTRTHPKGRKGCGGASPEIKVKRQAHFRIPMLGLGGSQELRERRRVLCCIDIDSETLFLSPLLRQYFLHCVLCDNFR